MLRPSNASCRGLKAPQTLLAAAAAAFPSIKMRLTMLSHMMGDVAIASACMKRKTIALSATRSNSLLHKDAVVWLSQ